jgi:hypothetical protein
MSATVGAIPDRVSRVTLHPVVGGTLRGSGWGRVVVTMPPRAGDVGTMDLPVIAFAAAGLASSNES